MKIEQNKTHSIHLRLTDEQYDYLRDNAELLGVTIPDWLRMYVNTMVVASKRLQENVGRPHYENDKNNLEHNI